ncbi:hypothetical protein PTKIN_Ptkin05aG0195600 [Pterospermum kingtungense]
METEVYSSSSDGVVPLLDDELELCSSGSLHKEDDNNNKNITNDNDNDFDDDLELQRNKRAKIQKLEVIEEKKEVSSKDLCTHPGSFKQMCILCGKRLDDEESGIPLSYIHKDLRLGKCEMVRLRSTDMKNLSCQKKLYLVLDLDNTLLNSTELRCLKPGEKYLKKQSSLQDDSKDSSLFMLKYMRRMTKLRPFVHTFLKEASKMYEMYIYTLASRAYALEMAKLLDPKGEYFNGRVISKDDGTKRNQKSLDVVLGQVSVVVILDDKEVVWSKHRDNLIQIQRYHYFASSCQYFGVNGKSLSQLKTDESEPDGALASVLEVLGQIHHIFFNVLDCSFAYRDVRQIMKTIRKEVLKGCKIVFSIDIPQVYQADNHPLWNMAEGLGAICSTGIDPSITHVVSTNSGTKRSRWALKKKKFLVDPEWIIASKNLSRKQLEKNFPVSKPKKLKRKVPVSQRKDQ